MRKQHNTQRMQDHVSAQSLKIAVLDLVRIGVLLSRMRSSSNAGRLAIWREQALCILVPTLMLTLRRSCASLIILCIHLYARASQLWHLWKPVCLTRRTLPSA